MRIQNLENQFPEGPVETNAPAGRKSHAKAAAKSDAAPQAQSVETTTSSQPYLQAALAVEPINAAAVEQARQLLESGQLDNADAAQRAAEAMLGGL